MANELFSTFAPVLRNLSKVDLIAEIERPKRLLIASESIAGRQIDIAYAAFDYINQNADVVFVGLTPGRQQMRNSLIAAQRCLTEGQSDEEAMREAKIFASFSGPMRANLVAMLDSVGVNRVLKLPSTASLWNSDARRVHFTSALRYPVFVDGANYSGAPSMLSTPLLRKHLMEWFATEMVALPKAVFIPLGPKVTDAVETVAKHLGFSVESHTFWTASPQRRECRADSFLSRSQESRTYLTESRSRTSPISSDVAGCENRELGIIPYRPASSTANKDVPFSY